MVAHTSGGRDAAGSSPVTPTNKSTWKLIQGKPLDFKRFFTFKAQNWALFFCSDLVLIWRLHPPVNLLAKRADFSVEFKEKIPPCVQKAEFILHCTSKQELDFSLLNIWFFFNIYIRFLRTIFSCFSFSTFGCEFNIWTSKQQDKDITETPIEEPDVAGEINNEPYEESEDLDEDEGFSMQMWGERTRSACWFTQKECNMYEVASK